MDNNALNVFEIERFAIHDGPGIRTTVFLKGCPLRCKWCANPESQSPEPQLMHLQKKCAGCGRCASACTNGAVATKNGSPVFDRAACKQCGACVRVCLNGALRLAGTLTPIEDIIATVVRDRPYYEHSGGGVTVSGGEPFMQYDGFIALLEACKRERLHVVVETCADVDSGRFASTFGLVDLYLFDLKHCDTEKLREWTGGDLGRILRNLDAATTYDPDKVVVRIPVVPGFNFDEVDIRLIFGAALERGVKDVHLLPYHTLGEGKYAAIGRNPPLGNTAMLRKEELEPLRELGERLGLNVKVGG